MKALTSFWKSYDALEDWLIAHPDVEFPTGAKKVGELYITTSPPRTRRIQSLSISEVVQLCRYLRNINMLTSYADVVYHLTGERDLFRSEEEKAKEWLKDHVQGLCSFYTLDTCVKQEEYFVTYYLREIDDTYRYQVVGISEGYRKKNYIYGRGKTLPSVLGIRLGDSDIYPENIWSPDINAHVKYLASGILKVTMIQYIAKRVQEPRLGVRPYVEGVYHLEGHSKTLTFPFTTYDLDELMSIQDFKAQEIWDATHGCDMCAEIQQLNFRIDVGKIPVVEGCPKCLGAGTVI